MRPGGSSGLAILETGPVPGLGESAIMPGLAAVAGSVSLIPALGDILAGSKLNTEPNLTCWSTGNLQRTSARYILTSPV